MNLYVAILMGFMILTLVTVLEVEREVRTLNRANLYLQSFLDITSTRNIEIIKINHIARYLKHISFYRKINTVTMKKRLCSLSH